VTFRPLRLRTGFHTLDRWLYNAALSIDPPAADVVVGIDLDGFLWARRRRVRAATPGAAREAASGHVGPRGARARFVVALKGIIADELQHERGRVRALLAIQARWERTSAGRADHVVVPSAYSAEVARRVYGVTAAKISVIPEPIDLAGWRARLASAERRAAGGPTVLAVARMYPRKHLHDLIHAAARLRERIPGLTVRIVGKGPEYQRLEALARHLGLVRTVEFLGEVSAAGLAVEYVSAQCFCLPSVQEGFGIVFAEALAAGLPVVACRAAAVPEVVEHGSTGLLVTPGRPDEIADALEQMLRNPDLRREMAVAGMKRVEAFDLERVARQWLPVLAP
jgi:phosphatidyl-myo-inositol dimannoside synthase